MEREELANTFGVFKAVIQYLPIERILQNSFLVDNRKYGMPDGKVIKLLRLKSSMRLLVRLFNNKPSVLTLTLPALDGRLHVKGLFPLSALFLVSPSNVFLGALRDIPKNGCGGDCIILLLALLNMSC